MIKKIKDWWFGPSASVYPCIPMTGKTGQQVWRIYRQQRKDYAFHGITTTSPVPGEGIKSNRRRVGDRKGYDAKKIWDKDGGQILKAPIIVFEKRCMASQGSIFELVKARGSLYKITVFVHPKPGFIARKQADVCARTRKQAAKIIADKFGSRHKRFKYRICKIVPKLPKGWFRFIKELFK